MADDDDKSKDLTPEQQLAKLIETLTPKLADALAPGIRKAVDNQIGGLVKKNDELLKDLVKAKDGNAELAKHVSDLEKAKGNFNPDKAAEPVTLTREQARSVTLYRAAKTEAAKRGVPLEVI